MPCHAYAHQPMSAMLSPPSHAMSQPLLLLLTPPAPARAQLFTYADGIEWQVGKRGEKQQKITARER